MREFPTTAERFLSDEQRAQVEVLFEAILPGAPDAPGARDAGAADYLDHLLATDAASYYEIPAWRTLYTTGLAALDAAAQTRAGAPLASLDTAQASALLEALAAGELDGLPAELDTRRLFTTLRGHCIEGCFADPRWGGNRNALVWRWLGYQAPAQAFVRGNGHA